MNAKLGQTWPPAGADPKIAFPHEAWKTSQDSVSCAACLSARASGARLSTDVERRPTQAPALGVGCLRRRAKDVRRTQKALRPPRGARGGVGMHAYVLGEVGAGVSGGSVTPFSVA